MKLETLHKDGIYHIYNRGINGENIFISDTNKQYFLKLLTKYLRDNAKVFAYCLMNNHFHLLLQIESENDEITQALSNLFNAYAKAFNKATNRTGSLFEKHFRRIYVKDEDYLRQLVVYIHLNPLHHFNQDYKQYRFSSYSAFLSDRETKLSKNNVMTLFGDIDNFTFVHQQKLDLLNEKYTFEK
jgi:putative transposase